MSIQVTTFTLTFFVGQILQPLRLSCRGKGWWPQETNTKVILNINSFIICQVGLFTSLQAQIEATFPNVLVKTVNKTMNQLQRIEEPEVRFMIRTSRSAKSYLLLPSTSRTMVRPQLIFECGFTVLNGFKLTKGFSFHRFLGDSKEKHSKVDVKSTLEFCY